VHLIDHLLDILERDPEFKYFLLDGQTILLDDYLFVRPEREQDLRKYINSGRILIGGFTFQHLLKSNILAGWSF
jgi:alpha-mannosidase